MGFTLLKPCVTERGDLLMSRGAGVILVVVSEAR